MGEIYHSDQDQPQQAGEAFRKFLQRYPQSTKAAAAQQELKEIQKTLARRGKQRREQEVAASSETGPGSTADGGLETPVRHGHA